MYATLFESILLLLTVASSYVISETLLGIYELEITAVLFACYFLIKKFLHKNKGYSTIDAIVFTLIIMNIINSTGGLQSHFFFLAYFLIFSLALIIQPISALITALGIILVYSFKLTPQQDLLSLMPLFSLPFLTPFAMLLGNEYRKNITQKKIITQNIEKTQAMENDQFTFLSIVIKSHLNTIEELSENFTGDHELDLIKKNIRRTKKLIEEYEKNSS